MQVTNLSNPGQPPIDGDLIRITYQNGAVIQQQYTAPVEPAEPSRRDVIRARLAEIDSITDRPRTRRELQLNKTATKAWLQTLDDEADALREELKAAKDVSAFVEFLKANSYKFSARQYNRAAEQLPLAGLDAISAMKDGQALFSLAPGGAQVMVLAGSRSQPVDEARAQPAIEQFLLNERKRKLVEDDLTSLRAAAKIEYVGDYADGHAKTMEEKLKVTPNSSPLVTAPASSPAEYMPPKPEPLASAPVDITPAESFSASSPSQRALESGLKGFK